MDNNINRLYGNNVKAMVVDLKTIEDREKRSRQAKAIVKVMEILNPSVKNTEEGEHKLWDHLFMLADFDLDVDAPYPCPLKADFDTKPVSIPMKDTKIRASHYGRNIEKILDLLSSEPDSPTKESLIRSLAIYMRTQYLIWNKDSVSDETIFADIEKLSEGRVKVPEGMTLSKIDSAANYARPGIGTPGGAARNKQFKKKANFRNTKRR